MNIVDTSGHTGSSVRELLQVPARALYEGRLVAFPTETVFGLGARFDDPSAVARIFEVKRRPFTDPLIVHIAHPRQLRCVVRYCTPLARRLMGRFWPGPLSVVLPRHGAVPPIVTAGLDTVCVRMPAHPLTRMLLHLAGVPVAAPSANLFSRVSPTSIDHVYADFGDDERIAWAIMGPPPRHGLESTIVDCTGPEPVILRHGAVSVESIARAAGCAVRERTLVTARRSSAAPGMLARHYAPAKPTVVCHDLSATLVSMADRPGRIAAICSTATADAYADRFPNVHFLRAGATVREIGRNLYASLRAAESLGDTIAVEAVRPDGIGRAVMDRLRRACVPPDAGNHRS